MGTAAVVTASLVGGFDANVVDGSPSDIVKGANNNDPDALRRLADTYTFKVEAETSSNNDPVTVLNLNVPGSGLTGVSWVGADNLRNITTKAWYRNVAGTIFGYSEQVTTVKGSAAGNTPALSATGLQSVTNDRTYRVRGNLTTLHST